MAIVVCALCFCGEKKEAALASHVDSDSLFFLLFFFASGSGNTFAWDMQLRSVDQSCAA
jgi:hypothetical protein